MIKKVKINCDYCKDDKDRGKKMKTHYIVYEFEGTKEANCGLFSTNCIFTDKWDKVTCLSCLDLKYKVTGEKKEVTK